MARGQATLELLLGYGIALLIISITLALFFIFSPAIFGANTTPTYSGFSGFNIIGQGYSNNLFFIKFQNLLNENININNMYFLTSGINRSDFVCTTDYLPNLGTAECNLSISMPSPFSATVNIYYTPSNTSTHPNILVIGSVNN